MANPHAKKAAQVAAEQKKHATTDVEGFSEPTPSQKKLIDWHERHGHDPESKKAVAAAREAGLIPDED